MFIRISKIEKCEKRPYNLQWLSVLSLLIVIGLTSGAHLQEKPQRIISLAPNITEIVYRINAGDKLVGRTEYCLYPAAAEQVASVGALLNPDYETMVALQPDIIFLLPNAEMESRLDGLGLNPVALPNETIDEILSGMLKMGELIGHAQQAVEAVAGIRDTLDSIVSVVAQTDSLSTLLLVGREPGAVRGLYAAGQSTYLSEILNIAGGTNVVSDVQMRYFDVTREDLLIRDPQVIFDFRIGSDDNPVDVETELQAWQSENGLQAVKKQQVFVITDRSFLIPGPRVGAMALQLHQLLTGASH